VTVAAHAWNMLLYSIRTAKGVMYLSGGVLTGNYGWHLRFLGSWRNACAFARLPKALRAQSTLHYTDVLRSCWNMHDGRR